METLSFAFGVLSIIGLLFVITIVIGAVKVIKQGKQIEELEQRVSNNMRDVCENTHRRFEEINRDLDQRINDIHRRIDEDSRNVHDLIDKNYSETISYTDSRLDKLEQKLTGALGTKQTLKA